jgi:hypothetical protein
VLGRFFHTGYVVRNVDAVMDVMRRQFGIAQWKVLRLDEGYASTALAYAYSNDSLIELVEVNLRQELRVIHRDWVPEDETQARLNHVAYVVDDAESLDALIERFGAAGLKTAWRSSFRDVFSDYCYIDTVARLGHFCEYACLGPAGREFLADIPRN